MKKAELKEIYEWRHKCTLLDTLVFKRTFTISKTLYGAFSLFSLGIVLIISSASSIVGIVLAVLIMMLSLVTGTFEAVTLLNTSLFICKDGLGIQKKNQFKTLPYKDILAVDQLEDKIKLTAKDQILLIPYKGFEESAIEGLNTIFRAEGFGGEPYPYALFFNDQTIVLEAKEDPFLVQVFDKFKEKFRYFHKDLDHLEIASRFLTRFQQLSDHSGVFHLKSLKVLKSHPLNAPMQDQKTDGAVLIFTSFKLESLTHNGRNLTSPYKTLRKLLHRSKIVKGEINHQRMEIDFISEKLLYKISFTYDKAYAAWNAFEKDAWYQIN